MKTIDCTPTWSAVLPVLLEVMINGKEEGKKASREELEKMARTADLAVKLNKEATNEIFAVFVEDGNTEFNIDFYGIFSSFEKAEKAVLDWAGRNICFFKDGDYGWTGEDEESTEVWSIQKLSIK